MKADSRNSNESKRQHRDYEKEFWGQHCRKTPYHFTTMIYSIQQMWYTILYNFQTNIKSPEREFYT
jgi:hypothetical protein